MSSLKKVCYEIKTDPILIDILLDGMVAWLQETPFDTTKYPPEYQALVTEQNQIGCIHYFQGCISLRWAELQQSHYNGFPPLTGRDSSSWSRKILCHIFTH